MNRVPLAVLFVLTLLGSGSAAAPAAAQPTVPVPQVEGPIEATEDSYPFLSSESLEQYDYVEREYFISGDARSYNGSTESGSSPYTTRLVVRAPREAENASGTVVLEWYNVTGAYDQEYDWFTLHEYFMRSGITWVGVSAQWLGVTELRRWNPERYGPLNHPGDQVALDIYAQAGQALLAPADIDPLEGRRPQLLLAAGHSQSGSRLATYYNDLQPVHGLFDGFMARGVEDVMRTEDVKVPAIRVQTETTATEGNNSADVDTDFYRRWEVAGTSHVDYQQTQYKDPLVERDRGMLTPFVCAQETYSRIPFTHALSAAYDHMIRWLETGTAPPAAPRLEANAAGVLGRDERGNALGGIQLPEHAVPTATNTGDNAGAGFCVLYGSHEPFDEATLRSLYETDTHYVAAYDRASVRAFRPGYLRTDDFREGRAAARAAELGLPAGTRALRLAGSDRVATAVEVSRWTHPTDAAVDTVVLARHDEYADALAGGPLAAAVGGPILLTERDGLNDATASEIERLSPARIILLGGEGALGAEVDAALREQHPDADIVRIAGANRFATAAAIAQELGATGAAFVVQGASDDPARGWVDAVAASPYAAFTGRPILLVEQGRVPAETAQALRDREVTEAIVVGGEQAVAAAVVEQLQANGHGPRRVAGRDRYATSVAVAEDALSAGMAVDSVWLATGLNWPDALTAGPAAAAGGHVLLLVDGTDIDRSAASAELLRNRRDDIWSVHLLGGTAAISDAVAARF